jgi:hypothetical protein
MMSRNGTPACTGWIHNPDRNSKTENSTPPIALAAVWFGARATTTRPTEKISAIASTMERMK